jgi:hypothetical protein
MSYRNDGRSYAAVQQRSPRGVLQWVHADVGVEDVFNAAGDQK